MLDALYFLAIQSRYVFFQLPCGMWIKFKPDVSNKLFMLLLAPALCNRFCDLIKIYIF